MNIYSLLRNVIPSIIGHLYTNKVSLRVCLDERKEKWMKKNGRGMESGRKTEMMKININFLCSVEKKNERMKNIFYINLLLCSYYIVYKK